MQQNIKEIVIVGGGSAGWMTAAALSSMVSRENVQITLVESEQIGTIGVGEATIPGIGNFNLFLGIDEAEFLKETKGTFKLGIDFRDWGQKGDKYMHPFGDHGVDMRGIDFHQYWLYSKAHGNENTIEEYSMCATTAAYNKFILPERNPKSILSQLKYAYHIDATSYARYLRSFSEERGVKRVEGKVSEVLQHPETGFITGLKMDNGETISGEFFFDCTGFSALIMEKTLNVPFNDWSHWLPCDSALAVACKKNGPLLPYTRATAKTAGWQWRIPTQHRTGNGHIYSSDYMSDDEATSVLVDGLDGEMIGTPRQIRFMTGHRKKSWSKNCIAIGLSAGFLEPLESTSLHLIQEGISRFLSLYPDASLPNIVRDEYNRFMEKEYELIRDFIILHYHATQRDDSPFWNYCRTMSIPESLQYKIDLFRTSGRVFRYEQELFSRASWVAVFLGQNITPIGYDGMVSSIPLADVNRSIDSMRTAMQRSVNDLPTHEAFINRYCPTSAV